MKILISSFGSHGDIHPYLALGRELLARGHEVTLATTTNYRDLIEQHGLSFVATRPEPSTDDTELIKKIMDPRLGAETVVKNLVMPAIRETYQDLEKPAAEVDLLVSHVLTYAVPILAEKTGKPWVSTILSPMVFASAHDLPALAPIPWLPRLRPLGFRINGWLLRQLKRISRSWGDPARALRKDLGLPPGLDPLWEGQHSPHCILAMFSSRFALPQPDWPANVTVTGFPFLDSHDAPLDAKLEKFFSQGEAPIVFTLGSAAVMADDGDFYSIAAAAAAQLNRRAVLVAGAHSSSLQALLPASAIAVDWASFPGLFARSAAVVHSGGIGTTAQALRAGVPQLVVPFAHDQFDNADRVRRLGCGRVLYRSRITKRTLVKELQRLLSDNDSRRRAQAEGKAIREENGAALAADTIQRKIMHFYNALHHCHKHQKGSP